MVSPRLGMDYAGSTLHVSTVYQQAAVLIVYVKPGNENQMLGTLGDF